MNSNLFIIIVTHNAMEWLGKCLKSTRNYQVVVVDNNSTDGTINYIANNFPKIILLKQNKNLGFGRANNIGITFALSRNAEYVFLLNQDAYLGERCLEILLNNHNKSKEYGILSPLHLNSKGDKLDKGFFNYVNYREEDEITLNYFLKEFNDNIFDVPFVNAAGWLVSKKCLINVGGFDPMFFHYGEDVNYSQRVLYHGLKIGIVPEANMLHDRENRIQKEIKVGTTEYFLVKERELKIKFGNPNFPLNDQLDIMLRSKKKSILRKIYKLKLVEIGFLLRGFFRLKRVKKEILESRKINKYAGMNYLNL